MTAWWLLVNGIMSFFEFKFALRFMCVADHHRKLACFFTSGSMILSFCVVEGWLPDLAGQCIHIAILAISTAYIMRRASVEIVAPITIIFTLSTCMDGISVVLMRVFVTTVPNKVTGNLIHMILTGVLVALFCVVLSVIARRYRMTAQQTMSSYLYTLLLPCGFFVWIARYGLGLDKEPIETGGHLFAGGSPLIAIVFMIGILAAFFTILEVFSKIVSLSSEEAKYLLQKNQLSMQEMYLTEARKRDERYRSYQHDIHNHLLVLSGLISQQKNEDAVQYLQKLRVAAGALLPHISTGNSVLDILLSEKIRYGEQNDIIMRSDVHIPPESGIDTTDLCVIFANALDNGIAGCRLADTEKKSIHIVTRMRHQFLLIEVTNTACLKEHVKIGTGIENIQNTAKKYGGTVELHREKNQFRISVLLCMQKRSSEPSAKPV